MFILLYFIKYKQMYRIYVFINLYFFFSCIIRMFGVINLDHDYRVNYQVDVTYISRVFVTQAMFFFLQRSLYAST